MMSEIVMAADVDEMVKLRMDANLTTLENDLGICERIFKTPVRQRRVAETCSHLSCIPTCRPSALAVADSSQLHKAHRAIPFRLALLSAFHSGESSFGLAGICRSTPIPPR